MARLPDPKVEKLDNQIVLLKKEGMTYKDIAEKLKIPVSRCRLAGRRKNYREYLRKYLKRYRSTHPEFYDHLKQEVKKRCRIRLRTDPEFRLKRNRYAKKYRNSIFGQKRLRTSDIIKAFSKPGEILSTRILVERLGKPTYHHFYSRIKAATKLGLIERVSWGTYKKTSIKKY